MAKQQKLSALVTIGGAVQKSLTQGLLRTSDRLNDIGRSVREVKRRQAELGRQRRILEQQGESVDHLDSEYQQLSNTLGELTRRQQRWQNVASQQRRVGQAYSRSKDEISRFARTSTLVVGGASAAIFGLASSTAALGDQTAKTADKLGIQIGALQELRYAAERSGVGADTFDMATQRMVRRLSEAANGSGEAKAAIEELGLDAAALASMTPDEALNVLSDSLAGVESQSERVRLAFKFFDSEGVAMVNMLKGGSEGLQQLRDDARKTGYVLSDQAARDAETFQDALLDTQLVMSGLKNTVGSALMPVVTDMMRQFSGWMRENRDQVTQFSERLATGLRDALPTIGRLATGLSSAAATLGTVTTAVAQLVGGFDNLGVIVGVILAAKPVIAVVSLAQSLWGLGSALVSVAGGFPAIIAGIKAIGVAIMANPIGLAIGAIIIGVGLIIKYWEPLSDFFIGLWDTIVGGVFDAWDTFKSIFAWTPLGLIINNWEPISEFMSNLWGGIKTAAASALDWVANKLQTIGELARDVADFFGFGDEEERDSDTEHQRSKAGRIDTRLAAANDDHAGLIPMGRVQYETAPINTPEAPEVTGRARYQVEPPQTPGIEPLIGRAEYKTHTPERPALQPVVGHGEYAVSAPETPQLELVVGRAQYETTAISPPEAPEVTGRARYQVEPPQTPGIEPLMGRAYKSRQRTDSPMPADVQGNIQNSIHSIQSSAKQETLKTPSTVNNNWQITIHQQPGQSVEELIDELEKRQREREQSALYDGAMNYG